MLLKEETTLGDDIVIESCIYSSRLRSWQTIFEKDEEASDANPDAKKIKTENEAISEEKVRKMSQKIINHANYGNQLSVRRERRKVSREEALVLLLQ